MSDLVDLSGQEVLGVNLQTGDENDGSYAHRCLAQFSCLFWLVVHVVGNAISLAMLSQENYDQVANSTTVAWSVVIVNSNFFVQNAGTHLLFIWVVHSHWNGLMDSLRRVYTSPFPLQPQCNRVRYAAIAAVSVILIAECGFVVPASALLSKHSSLLHKIGDCLTGFMQVYPASGILLIAIIGWSLAEKLRHTHQHINDMLQLSSNANLANLPAILATWKARHAVMSEAAHDINRCFGMMLLINISCLFVHVIMLSFQVLSSFPNNGLVLAFSTLYLTKHLVHLWIICFVADSIQNEALQILHVMRKADLLFSSHREQVNSLMIQVIQSVPKLSAAGFFSINQKIIPKLVGTTLTYLVILHQFKSDEKPVSPCQAI